jgi:hypothetical protein
MVRMRALFRVLRQLGPRHTGWAKTKENGAGMFLRLMGLLCQLHTWILYPYAFKSQLSTSNAVLPFV